MESVKSHQEHSGTIQPLPFPIYIYITRCFEQFASKLSSSSAVLAVKRHAAVYKMCLDEKQLRAKQFGLLLLSISMVFKIAGTIDGHPRLATVPQRECHPRCLNENSV